MLKTSLDDEVVRDRESRKFGLDCKGESSDFHKRVRECENDLDNGRAFLWGRCRLTLCDRIEDQYRFQTVIRSNPIELLLAIKHIALDREEFRACVPDVTDACRACFNWKHHDNEYLADRTSHFEVTRVILYSRTGGPILVSKSLQEILPEDAQV